MVQIQELLELLPNLLHQYCHFHWYQIGQMPLLPLIFMPRLIPFCILLLLPFSYPSLSQLMLRLIFHLEEELLVQGLF
jgi:hypothetical protein